MRPEAERIRLTQKIVSDLKPLQEKRRHVYDNVVPAFAVCITQTGSKSFYWIGRVGKSVSRLQIGKWPKMSVESARDEAKKISADVANGDTPKPRKFEAKISTRIGNVWTWYLENIAKPKHKAWRYEQSAWENDLSQWSLKRFDDLKKSEVIEKLNDISKRGPGASNRAIDLLRSLFRCAEEHFGVKVHDYTQTLEKHQYDSRDRFLLPDEVFIFFESLNRLSRESTRDFFKMAVFTGARRGNVLSMRYEEIDFSTKLWRIPREKSKSGREMKIQLSGAAIDILTRRMALSSGSPWVFPSSRSSTGHLVDVNDSMDRIRKHSGLKDLRIHDLRRTLGSWQAMTGASLINIGKSLGHRSTNATKIYAQLTDSSVSESINKAINAILAAGNPDPAE